MKYLIFFLSLLFSFLLSLLSLPLVTSLSTKLKAKQPILKYVEQHKSKAGTPTMGGLAFVIPSCLIAVVFSNNGLSAGRIAAIATISYCLLGFLDDFLKVKRHNNGGLTPMQKIIGQLGIAGALAYYCYKNDISRLVRIPFTNTTVNFGYWIIPFAILIFLAVTNAVNLTDGLDGLAGNTTFCYLLFFFLILFAMYQKQIIDISLAVFSVSIMGGILAFLIYNSKPAKIFMGDTGSLALGGAVASVAMFSGNSLIIPIIGIMYVVSCISVIIQVIVFKISKKRVFKMAPFHHHLEKCGMSEPRIVAIYTAVTVIFGALGTIAVLISL